MQGASTAWQAERVSPRRRRPALAHGAFLAAYTLIYFLVTVPIAAHRLLWADELFTLFLSRGRGFGQLWQVLSTGADAMPPTFHVITHAALNLPGRLEIIVRAPEILGFWVM